MYREGDHDEDDEVHHEDYDEENEEEYDEQFDEDDNEQDYKDDYDDELFTIEVLTAFAQRQEQIGNRDVGRRLRAAGMMWLLKLHELRSLKRIDIEGEEIDDEGWEEIARQKEEARAFKRELNSVVLELVTRLTK